jgi:hypothetical protein
MLTDFAFAEGEGLTRRWSRPRGAVLSSFARVHSVGLEPRVLPLAAAHLVLVRS